MRQLLGFLIGVVLALVDRRRRGAPAVTPPAPRVTVDGPSGLTDVLVDRFGWDRQHAAEVANVAVWHLESPLVAAIEQAYATPPCDPHPITGRCSPAVTA